MALACPNLKELDIFLEKSGLRDGVLTTVPGVRNLVHATVFGTFPCVRAKPRMREALDCVLHCACARPVPAATATSILPS